MKIPLSPKSDACWAIASLDTLREDADDLESEGWPGAANRLRHLINEYVKLKAVAPPTATSERRDDELRDGCSSCGEEMPRNECPKSLRGCGHHCNHSWSGDSCCWCGAEFGEETSSAAAPTQEGEFGELIADVELAFEKRCRVVGDTPEWLAANALLKKAEAALVAKYEEVVRERDALTEWKAMAEESLSHNPQLRATIASLREDALTPLEAKLVVMDMEAEENGQGEDWHYGTFINAFQKLKRIASRLTAGSPETGEG